MFTRCSLSDKLTPDHEFYTYHVNVIKEMHDQWYQTRLLIRGHENKFEDTTFFKNIIAMSGTSS